MGKDLSKIKTTFFFCDGGSCQKAGSEVAARNVRAYLRNENLMNTVHTIKTRCNGRCEDAPTMIVQNGNYWYKKIDSKIGVEIAQSHIEKQQPIDKYLLYKPAYDKVDSHNERTPFKLKPFEYKADEDLGACWIMKGFSSDQYLHPLFLYIMERPNEAKIILANGKKVPFSIIKELRYSKKFELELETDTETIEFVIASIPKDREDLIPLKVSITEYFFQEETNKVGLRFKNKKGEIIAHIYIGSIESEIWEYCTKIQLQGNQIKPITI